MSDAQTDDDKWGDWSDRVQAIVSSFVQNDEELGELMLDHSERYWDRCYNDGLTPQQALDKFIESLNSGTQLKRYKDFKREIENDGWWTYKMRSILVELSRLSEDDEEKREHQEHELELLVEQIILRYRDTPT